MGKFYIYNSTIEDKKHKEITIIFNPNTKFDFNSLRNELTNYFKNFHQTSALVFIHCTTNLDIQNLISENIEHLLKSIPKVEEGFLKDNIFFVSYNHLTFYFGKRDKFLKDNFKEVINQGLVNIFVTNGGLVESNGISHHFVFPSGKHSSKFLRAANVLVKKSEIDFIALNTLHLFNYITFENIYCDTLSISVIGYSMCNFLRRFDNEKEINIESFKSYSGLFDKHHVFYDNSIFLISASTSGGLIEYLKKNHGEINSNEICTLFYLPLDKDTTLALERVVCNLGKSEKFGHGIDQYDIYKPPNKPCKYCINYSTPIQILGDSFNLDEPIINTKNIVADKYISNSLKDFVELFKYKSDIGTSLKISFSEDSISSKKYNLYIDYEKIIDNIDKYPKHKSKIDAYIKQYIPSSTKFIIHLNDKGSQKLAEYIHTTIQAESKREIEIINQSDLQENEISKEESGSVLIVGSCITNGKNLLYLNRFFRNFEGIRLVYFIGINRASDTIKYKELKSNIKYGFYGPDNSSFVEIETINCDNSNFETPWEVELKHLKNIQEKSDDPIQFITERIETINLFSDTRNKGGSNKIFYPGFNNKELEIRKNSAFFNDNNYYNNITQSDVYFTISCVINNMRNDKNDGLIQTSFVKNLLDPFVFNRFNDGIIQASILRAARDEELNYSFSQEKSGDMLMLIKTFIMFINEYQGESIFEFLNALAIGKLRLYKEHYLRVIEELDKFDDIRINIFKESISNFYQDCI